MGLSYSCAKKENEPLVVVTVKSSCCNKKKLVFQIAPDKVKSFVQDVEKYTQSSDSISDPEPDPNPEPSIRPENISNV